MYLDTRTHVLIVKEAARHCIFYQATLKSLLLTETCQGTCDSLIDRIGFTSHIVSIIVYCVLYPLQCIHCVLHYTTQDVDAVLESLKSAIVPDSPPPTVSGDKDAPPPTVSGDKDATNQTPPSIVTSDIPPLVGSKCDTSEEVPMEITSGVVTSEHSKSDEKPFIVKKEQVLEQMTL